MEGLEEKFIVLNREPLAEALRCRLDELSKHSSRWTPEILSLLLNLSNRPADNTNLTDLEKEDEDSDPLPQLTWADIVAEDPLTEDGIWDDVVIESDYSDDELQSLSDDSLVEHTTSTQASSLADEDIAAFARSFIITKDETVLEDIRATRAHLQPSTTDKPPPSATNVSEYQAVREVLLMLHGLPTSLFVAVSSFDVRPQSQFHSSTCDPSTFSHVMHDFAALGSQLCRLREWVVSPPQGELPQRLSASVQQRITSLERSLTQIEQQLLSPHPDTIVSLLYVHSRVQHLSKPLLCLAAAISHTDPDAAAWDILDSLFDAVCALQLGEREEDFVYIAEVFFECLEVYCRSIHLWMTQGKLEDQDDRFFVRLNDENVDRGSLWHSRFSLSKRPDGTANAPKFMQSAVTEIFSIGKSVMFLEALQHETLSEVIDHTRTRGLNARSVLTSLDNSLLPFAGVFEQELQKWIASLQTHSMPNLRHTLLSRCGLIDTLDVISHLFLASDGARFQTFADELFVRMDRNRPWTDRFILTEMAQTTIGELKCFDAGKISARVSKDTSSSNVWSLPIDSLDRIVIDYTISWPLKNVISDFSVCQRAFVMSLRAYRAEYLLTKQQWAMMFTKSHGNGRTRHALALRQRLIWFTAIFRGYTAEMVEVSMRELRENLETTLDGDGMAEAYDKFQSNLEAKLLLRKSLRPILQSLFGLLRICEDFSILWRHLIDESEEEKTDSYSAKSRSRRNLVNVDFSDEESDAEPDVQQPCAHDISGLSKDYERQLHFVIAGLRSVSRVGGESSWISLAERLQLGTEHIGKS